MGGQKSKDLPVITRTDRSLLTVALNRPDALNSLNLDMVRRICAAMDEAAVSGHVRAVLLRGIGPRAFCAGGDIKSMAQAAAEHDLARALQFLEEEYALDLLIHRFPKPVVVLAHGITMGGGLGLAAGADIVVAEERTRMAMPETRIGFFPDVGATGWMFSKCPPGYPEFLGLTGYEMKGAECVRLGFADCLIPSARLHEAAALLERHAPSLSADKTQAARGIRALLEPLAQHDIPANPAMDLWVRDYFQGKTSVAALLSDLGQCSIEEGLCEGVFRRLSERSPTAVALTLQLLLRNRGRPMEAVFQADLKAAQFVLQHPDFIEGVRARLKDKDDRPRWRPATFEEVGLLDLDFGNS